MAPDTPYHHGDLPQALRAATADLVAERGPVGFSLREVARRAGVSHAAPAHHFGDSKGLLTSVAAEGFERLNDAFVEALAEETDPVERLKACGRAYVSTAIDYPGHFGVMCADDIVNKDDPAFVVASVGAYGYLLGVIADLRDAINPELDVEAAATLTWSSVHGLAVLSGGLQGLAEKTGTKTAPLNDLIDQFSEMLISGFAAR